MAKESAAPAESAAPSAPAQEAPRPVGIGPAFDEAGNDPEAPTPEKSPYDVGDPSELPIPEKEPETVPEAEIEPEAPEGDEPEEMIDADLEARGHALGLTSDQMAEYGSNELLAMTLNVLATRGQVAPEKKPEIKQEQPEFKIDLDPKEYDEKVVKTFNDLHAHYQKKFADLEAKLSGELSGVKSFTEQAQAAQQEANIDTVFKGMEDLKELVGDAPLRDLPMKSPLRAARMQIVQQAQVLQAGFRATGKAVPELPKLIRAAAQIVLGDQTKKIATQEVRKKLVARSDQFISRPTARNSGQEAPTKNGTDRAVSAVHAILEKAGHLD